MLEQLGLLSDNFYKFLTTLSLAVCVYCASFTTLFLEPYAKSVFEIQRQSVNYNAEHWFLEGVKKDLLLQLGQFKDTSKMAYWYYYISQSAGAPYRDDSISQSNKYYYVKDLDSSTKLIVDSLNKVNYQILIDKQMNLIYMNEFQSQYDILRQKEIFCWVAGILSFLVFVFGMYKWSKLKPLKK